MSKFSNIIQLHELRKLVLKFEENGIDCSNVMRISFDEMNLHINLDDHLDYLVGHGIFKRDNNRTIQENYHLTLAGMDLALLLHDDETWRIAKMSLNGPWTLPLFIEIMKQVVKNRSNVFPEMPYEIEHTGTVQHIYLTDE